MLWSEDWLSFCPVLSPSASSPKSWDIKFNMEAEYEGFNLARDTENDEHIGEENQVNLLCPNCYCCIIPQGNAKKVQKEVSIVTPS